MEESGQTSVRIKPEGCVHHKIFKKKKKKKERKRLFKKKKKTEDVSLHSLPKKKSPPPQKKKKKKLLLFELPSATFGPLKLPPISEVVRLSAKSVRPS